MARPTFSEVMAKGAEERAALNERFRKASPEERREIVRDLVKQKLEDNRALVKRGLERRRARLAGEAPKATGATKRKTPAKRKTAAKRAPKPRCGCGPCRGRS